MSYSQSPDYWSSEAPSGPVIQKGASRGELVRPIVGEVLPPVRLSDPVAMLPAPQAAPIHLDAPAPALSHTGHIWHQDDAITNARASLLYSRAIILITSIGITAILFLVYLNQGGDLGIYFGVELLALSGAALVALLYNRGQGLHHSASGIAHSELRAQERIARRHAQIQEYEIDSRERVATYAIDRHVELVKTRWQLEAGQGMKQLGVNRDP